MEKAIIANGLPKKGHSMEYTLMLAVIAGMAVLLFMILRLKLPAFIALLFAAIITGLLSGMDPSKLMDAVKNGMGGTLGFVATIVGLGTIFGGILQHTGSAGIVATQLLRIFGERRAPWALMITGFLVSIPIFFDVGIVILFPVVAALQEKTGKNIIHFALPLLAGLAVSHAFIPPTPGPLAVAEILGVPLGWMVAVGIICGLPAAYVAGIWYGKYAAVSIQPVQRIYVQESIASTRAVPNVWSVFAILLLPILLIIGSTVLEGVNTDMKESFAFKVLLMFCHPFSALIIANILAWYILGRHTGVSATELSGITAKSLQPAGMIILVTGAGGVFKQILMDTGAGKMIADSMQYAGFSLLIFAFLAAAAIRIMQGSATVAMITAAGLVAPLLPSYQLVDGQLAALGVAIASGATVLSHLNDSGFWLIKEYFSLTEREGIRMWTVASSLLGITGLILSAIVYYSFG